ncbi:hypothetical protein Y032_0034g2957 [Ancylostoma ceylanicum]|nr:hypothetical protein Y032_0034g2957 [Ancylostoma ceylanicum]
MLPGVRRAALESVVHCRAFSTTGITRTYDPRCILSEGFDPNKRIRLDGVVSAFMAAGMFTRQPTSQEFSSLEPASSKDDTREKRPFIAPEVLALHSPNQMADTLPWRQGNA